MHIEKKSTSPSKKYPPGSFMARLKERKIIATLAAFIGGGWLTYEVVHWILVDHYHLPNILKDITIVTFLGALLSTVIWRWFRGVEKRPGSVKVEVLVVPLIILITLVIDLKLVFIMTGISIHMLLIGIITLCLGIAWVVFKSLQWAASVPISEKEVEVLKPIKESQKAEPISFPEWKKSIVVLPFENISPEEGQDYFCDGMTEEIITDLSSIHDLRVISRSSAMMLKSSKKAVRDIAQELNVQYVLEGSVRKAGNDIRITAQLIDATIDAHLWAEKFSGALDDVFDIQESVSRSIVDALKLKLSPEADKKIAERPINNVHAYELYMRARQEMFKYTDDSLQRALQHLKNGLNIIGENILFYSGMGYVYYQYFDTGLRIDQDYGAKTEKYANKIFKLDPYSSHGHRLIGLVKLKRDNAYEGYKHLKQAHISDPNDWDTLFWLGYVLLLILGKKSVAVPLIEKALEIDPLTPVSQALPAILYWMEDRFDLALEFYDKWKQMEPDSLVAKWYFAQLLLWNHRADEANKFIDEFARDAPGHFLTQLILFLKFAYQKKKKEAYAAFNTDVKKWAWNDFHLPWYGAECFALLDERDEAIRWLEHAVDRVFINYPLFAELDPFLENIRGEPRFKKLMERVKHEWENFEV